MASHTPDPTDSAAGASAATPEAREENVPAGDRSQTSAEAHPPADVSAASSRNGRDGGLPEADARELLQVLQDVRRGDFTARMSVSEGRSAQVAQTLNDIIEQNESLVNELRRARTVVGQKGELDQRVSLPGLTGDWVEATSAVNELVIDLAEPINEMRRVIGAVERGDLSRRMELETDGRPMRGEFRQTAKTINAMVEQLAAFADEVTRVAREVGTEGKLGGRAEIEGVSGTWEDLTENVNSMADNLTTQVRGIAAVTKAVAEGDLSKKVAVDAKGEIADLADTINAMVDTLDTFASEVTRVAREVGTEGKLGGQAHVPGASGTWEDLTENVNSMASNLTDQVRGIAQVSKAVADGDLSKKVTVDAKGEIADLADTINAMVGTLDTFAGEVTRVAREVGVEGRLGGQASVPGASGTWEDLTENVNSMADNLTDQVRGIAGVARAVADGDLSKKITVGAKGEVADLADTINAMVDTLDTFASEVTRVAREVGTEGKLGGQATVPGASGTWADLTENVNSMADNLTDQVRGIAAVTTAVAEGDLSKKVAVDAKGEIADLADTINAMVGRLDTFASEVTRVAREVGTEGQLGGQASVPGVSGTWEDLTENVNSMADNLTDQVRGLAEVSKAVAEGDLSKKVTVDAKGEIADLAGTINAMVDTLDTFAEQVTTVAREVGVEGELGGQAHVPGAAGTWRDLTDNVNSMADNLTTQVREMIEVAESVADGDFSKEITVGAAGEVAALRDSVNEMIRTLKDTTQENKNQDWLKTNLTRVTRDLQSEEELEPLASMVLSELAPLTNARHGAFYLAEYAGDEPVPEDPTEDPERLRLISAYAYNERKRLANSFAPGEGLVGQCALEKERIALTSAPSDYVQIGSGLGEAPALNVVVVPVLFEGKVRAAFELASFEPFGETQLTFLDQLADSIGIVVNTVQTSKRTEALLEQSQQLTGRLQSQQEELSETNVELEEQARELERRQEEVDEKEREIELARDAVEEKAEQLELTSKYRSEFLANMSHELRTPLNSMLILARMFSENKQGNLDAEQVEYAKTMHASGADLLSLINEILDLSKIESGSMSVEVEPVPTEDVAQNMERLFREVAAQNGVNFSVTVEDGVPAEIETDEKRLQQILKNLLSNALKFTDEGEVSLRIARGSTGTEHFESDALQATDEVIAFAVSDTGVGISAEQQDLIFEAFQQAEGGDARAHGGTGLGLSISREIADLLGGELRLESVPGQGSTFTFYLPATYDREAAEERTHRRRERHIDAEGGASGDGARREAPQQRRRRRDRLEERAQRPQVAGRGPRRAVEEGEQEEDEQEEDEQEEDEQEEDESSVPSGGRPQQPSATGETGEENEATEAEMAVAGVSGMVEDDRDNLTENDLALLIVEDDARFAGILLKAARERGFKGIVATRGAEVMELARRYAPNAITLDMQLPDEHGVEVLRRLKDTPGTRSIPVVIMSVEEELPRVQRRGAVTQISKPITEESVAASLDKLQGLAERELRTLLIIEDDASQRTSLAALVRGDDVQVTSVGTGAEALKALNAATFDCAIVDLGLPDMDGFDLVEKMRSKLGLKDLPIIVHTAQDLSPAETDALHELAEAVILKDVSSFDQLLEETAVFLRRADLDAETPHRAPGRRPTGEDVPETAGPERSVQRPTRDAGSRAAEAAMQHGEGEPGGGGQEDPDGKQQRSAPFSPGHADASEPSPPEEASDAPPMSSAGEAPSREETGAAKSTDERHENGKKEGGGLLDSIAGDDGAQAEEPLPGEQAAHERERMAAQEPERQGPRQPEHPADDLSGKKVFIVDDDVQNIFALTSLLEGHDLEVDYAESGQEGIDRLEQREESDPVDAVLMDIMMPGMDGYETMRRMRTEEQFQDLPIVAVTAKALKGDREKCIAAGASDYITKPVDAEQLLALLRAWIPA